MNDTTTTPRILADLHFLTDLVRQIGPERVNAASIIGGPSIHATDREDGHAIAAELGLAEFHGSGTTHWYQGSIDGHDVTVYATPRYTVVDSDTGETLTPPLPHADATALVAATTGRNVHVVAVTR